jgi:hypothetical protein
MSLTEILVGIATIYYPQIEPLTNQIYPIASQAGIVGCPIELLSVRCVRSFSKLALWVAR